MRVVTKKEIQIIDPETGEIQRTFRLATEKQIAFIRKLELQAGETPRSYKDLALFQASKVIEQLKKKAEKKRQEENQQRFLKLDDIY